MNQSIPPPPHPNDDSTPPPSFNPSPEPSNQPLVNALSLLTNLGGRSNCIELQDLLNHLNLQKYSEVFVKQEVSFIKFNTLIMTITKSRVVREDAWLQTSVEYLPKLTTTNSTISPVIIFQDI